MSVELYDPVANPYAPGAGTPPPALVGRDQIIEAAEVALSRLVASRASQHLLITGLRGVGKTVLLGKVAAVAERLGYRVIRVEALGGEDTISSVLRQARRILEEFDGGARVTRALRSIESVSLTLAGTGVSVERQAHPDREALSDVITDVARAAEEAELGVMLALDEAQMLDRSDLRRLLAGVHRCGQDGLPMFTLIAGLPNLIGEVAKAATYAERMFQVWELGPLSPDEVMQAVVDPAAELGVSWDVAAAERIVDLSDGFPFFVQTWAYHTWNAAMDDPISLSDVERAVPNADHALDASFFAARIARIPASEVAYVQALASLGAGPHRSGEVAAAGGKATAEVAAFRDRLIHEGVIYAPRYGWVEFAIPHFDRYVMRVMPPS
ncbi:MAG: ATP-binding protein [Acidimicrobiia bacterium]|nr:ATP-binding protein [Acidimicrobiia bacterium]NNC42304.1 AAA family ATPase [Acidimicrobiia bacterium]NND13483.1 AAA family ATPase [Acidimicrobiia bacterium]NNL48746.1 AAA family ATPase [Acidimicrobiia bacterium]